MHTAGRTPRSATHQRGYFRDYPLCTRRLCAPPNSKWDSQILSPESFCVARACLWRILGALLVLSTYKLGAHTFPRTIPKHPKGMCSSMCSYTRPFMPVSCPACTCNFYRLRRTFWTFVLEHILDRACGAFFFREDNSVLTTFTRSSDTYASELGST